jgi:hypothetical protein
MFRVRSLVAGLVVLTHWVCVAPPAYSQPTGYDGYQVVEILVSDEADLGALGDLQVLGRDFQIWSEAVGLGLVEARVAPAAQRLLAASGLRHEVAVADLQQYLDERFGGSPRGDFFDSLRTYDEHVQFMSDLVAANPDLAEMVTVGLSVEGRPLWALRITGPGADKPGVIYHGAQHGNEAAGASVVAYAAYHLLTNYTSDPEVTTLVDNVEWFLLPIMNPDGYVDYDRWNANGVDLNRNWGGPGSGQDPWGGPYPFSEPETAAMRDFFQAHRNVRVHIDFHGYVPWLMWPWGHRPELCRDHWTFHMLGTELHDLVYAAGGGSYEFGPIWWVAYPVYGGSIDYSYGVRRLWGFAFELADDQVPGICVEFLPTMLFLSGWISDCNANGIPDAEDIAAGASRDINGNSVPDECECFADVDNDGDVDLEDLATLLSNYGMLSGAMYEDGDLDLDGDVDLTDLAGLLSAYGTVCE